MKKVIFTDTHRFPVPYANSSSTDITRTFARIRKQQAEAAAKAAEVQSEAQLKVRKLK